MALKDKTDAELREMDQDIANILKKRKANELDKIPARFLDALKKRINKFSKQLSFKTTKTFTITGNVLFSFYREEKGVGIDEMFMDNDWEAEENRLLDQFEASPEFVKTKKRLSKEADSIASRVHELANKYQVDSDLLWREVDYSGIFSM